MAEKELRQIDLFEMPPAETAPPAGSRRREIPRNEAPATPKKTASETETTRSPFRLRYLLLVLVIGAAVAVWSWYTGRMAEVHQVSVSDHYFTAEEDIIRAAAITIGTHADSIAFSQVIQRIEQLPYIREARIVPVPPSTILIRIQERRPVGLVTGSNVKRYIDSEGIVLPVIPGKAVEVPLIYGINLTASSDTLKGTTFEALGAFLAAFERYDIARATISDVAWQTGTGIVAAGGEYGTRIVFGLGDYDEKLRNWQAFYTQVVPKTGLNTFTNVDLRYKAQIVTEKRS